MYEPDDIDTMSDEEIDALLRDFGHDPAVVWLDAVVFLGRLYMRTSRLLQWPRPDRGRAMPDDEFTNTAWCLVYSMMERGVDGSDPWWGEDFLRLKKLLEAKGLNCDPSLAGSPDETAANVLSGDRAARLIELLTKRGADQNPR